MNPSPLQLRCQQRRNLMATIKVDLVIALMKIEKRDSKASSSFLLARQSLLLWAWLIERAVAVATLNARNF
jgi:hypothetical protein